MSISVGFTTESKRENSTKQRTMSTTQSCLFKNGCSMLYPTLLLELDTDSFPAYTGFKIEDRYYNVTDIKSVRQNLFEISGEVDVLATYKTEIGNATEFVNRAAGAYNPYVIDTKYPALADSDLASIYLSGLATDSEGAYIVGIAGTGHDAPSTVTYYAFNAYTFSELCYALFDENYLDGSLTDITLELQKELLNPFQYIVSCYWYPVPYTYFSSAFLSTVYFGWWTAKYTSPDNPSGLNTVVAIRVDESQRIYSWEDTFQPPKHPQNATRGIYLNAPPYTKYTLNCYSFGSIPLNPSPFVDGDAGAIEIDVDLYTGVAQMYVACAGNRMFTAISQFGVPIQINQNTANVIGGAVSAFAGGAALARGNVTGGASGIVSAITDAFPQVQSQGANGSKVAFMQTPNIVAEFHNISDEDNTTMGRPLCAPRQINSLSGYIECESVDIQLACTSTERIKVIDFMESGFFYE